MTTGTGLSEPVMQAIRSGRTIHAIKLLREETGLGLKEAKDVVDREAAAYREAHPHVPMTEERSPWGRIVLIAAVGALLFWYLSTG